MDTSSPIDDSSNERVARSPLSQFVAGYCGDYYGIADQKEGESDRDFQVRVSSLLRDKGKVIEAHEVRQGALYDDEEKGGNVLEGVMGAMSIAMSGARYGANVPRGHDEQSRGEAIVDDECIAGQYNRLKQENPDPPLAALLLAMGINPFEMGIDPRDRR